MKGIHTYVKNLDKYDEKSKANIVGSDKKVESLGKAWYNNSESIQISMIHLLNEFNTTETFDSKEQLAFRKGLNALPKLMMECYDEYDLVNQREEGK